VTSEEYLACIRTLLPAVRERALLAEQLRRMPDETMKEFQEAGLFRCMQPKRYHGYELDPGTFYRGVMEVAAVCGSTGWILAVLGVHNWHLALYPPQAQEDVWGEDPSVLISTGLSPTGLVERVVGGFRLRGRWSYSSGCDFCRWAVVSGVVPQTREGDPRDVRTFLVPRRDYTIDDTWYVMGLAGSGSKDVVVADAFVPDYRTHSYLDAFHLRNPGMAINDSPVYRLPFALVFANSLASAAVGVARGAVGTFRAQSQTRVNVRDHTRAAEDPFIHLRLAEAAAEVDAARERMLTNYAEMMRLVSAGKEIPLSDRARYRWDSAKAVDWSVRAVDRMFEASGGRGIFLDNPIQRAWRDVHAMRAHVANNPEKIATVFGRSEFGLPPTDIGF
jgi:3-hydroxy-9,10-secoandrosta-1,3,5(10)-triene-9,17-dione monooxygenase